MQFSLSKFGPHLAAAAIFLGLSVAYFAPQFQGKVIQQGDIVQYLAMSHEARAYQEQSGEYSLWTNAMFGGMPTYQIRTVVEGNQLRWVEKLGRLGIDLPAGQFFTAMLGFYLMLVLLGVNPWLSIVGAIAFGFTSNNLILYEAGHETKLKAISYFPLMAAGLLLAFRGRYLWGAVLFGLGLGLDLTANHIQMTYYLLITVLVLGVAQLIHDARNQQLPRFLKAAGALTLGGLLAIGSVAANLWITYEYAKDTMRGEPILERAEGAAATSSSETDGLEWSYAMQWSNGVIDLVSSFIPGAAGGGSSEPSSRASAYGQALTRLGARLPETFDAPLYWGELPFTSGPAYVGAAVVFFFVLGLFLVKGPVKWWLGLGVLLTLALSMGKNMEWLNRLFFDYFPLYNKFRTPNSVLSVTSFLAPMLALLGLHQVVSGQASKAEATRALLWSAGITGGVALFFVVLGPSMFTFARATDQSTLQRMLGGEADAQTLNNLLAALQETRQDLLRSDALRSLLWVGLSAGLLWFFLQQRINVLVLAGGLALITLVDLWGVDQRYLNRDDFKPATNLENNFAARPVDTDILKDTDPNYRVLDLTVDPFNSAAAAYFHKSVGGYHAAKLQRYQDLIDRHLQDEIQQFVTVLQGRPNDSTLRASFAQLPVLNMLNTRYFIYSGDQPPLRNLAAQDNAWLVDSIAQAPTANAEIDALGTVALDRVAVVHQEFANYLQGLTPTGEGSIRLTEYRPNRVTYRSDSPSEQLAVFSEVWYGPDKGWQAYIDGQPVPHIRANYALRALRIPAGPHEIKFVFEPKAYAAGVRISWISSLLLLLAPLAYWAYLATRPGANPPAPASPTPPPTDTPRAAPEPRATVARKKKK